MLVENIVNNLYAYIAENNFNGFYDYLIEKLKYSTIEDCNLIVETFLNNLKYEKYYNMYSPIVKSVLEKELSSRKIVNSDSNKSFKEEENKILENPIFINLKMQLANKDLEGFKESLAYLVNEAKEQSELEAIISSVRRLIETIKNDSLTYKEYRNIFKEIIISYPIHKEKTEEIKEFINSHGFASIKNDTNVVKK